MKPNKKVRDFIGVMFDNASCRAIGYEVRVNEKRYLRFFDGNVVCIEPSSLSVFVRKFGNFAFDVNYIEDFEFWKETNGSV